MALHPDRTTLIATDMPRTAGPRDVPAAGRPGVAGERVTLKGLLHAYVAFDWGEEIRLDRAQKLFPAELQSLARRRRTPASITYRPPPLRYTLASAPIELPEIGRVSATAEATVFDFGGVSVALHIPFQLSAAQLVRVASALSDATPLIDAARAASSSLHAALLPAIDAPRFSELTEEYFVFQMPPGEYLPAPAALLAEQPHWLAALARLESEPLSPEEINQAIQAHISYSPMDLFLPDWSAAVLIDRDCDETLQVIEFANLQLLEFRFLDNLLDDQIIAAYQLIQRLTRRRLPFWRSSDRYLRSLGELRIDANNVFERTGNALKLVGDQYLARVYQLLAARFHLNDWERNIERSLEVIEKVYQVVSDQSAHYRTEFLELVVIFLIAFEIVMAFIRH